MTSAQRNNRARLYLETLEDRAAPAVDLSALDGSNGFVINGTHFDGRAGYVSDAGDVNGDGFDDIAIAANNASPNGNRQAGEAYVVFGRASGFDASLELSSLDGSNGFVIPGIDEGDSLGVVSAAGDINGDGFDDILIGALGNGRAGESYVVFGRSGFDAVLDLGSLNGDNGFVVYGIAEGDLLAVVSGAGDVNGDGFDDIVIGAPYADANDKLEAGTTYVIFGRPSGFDAVLELANLNGSNGFVIYGIGELDHSGWVSGAGDVNGDGFDDILIGASGKIESYVVFGRSSGFDAVLELSSLDETNGFILKVGAASWVSSAGDVNGDGLDDILIGDPHADPNGNDNAGGAYVIFGRQSGFEGVLEISSLDGTNGFVINGIDGGDNSGEYVSSAGDVNGDGLDDILIGSTRAGDQFFVGESYVVFGRSSGFEPVFELSSLDNSNGFVIPGIDERDWSGVVSGAGDVNGDGIDDILIGAYQADPIGGNRDAGESYVIFGVAENSTPTAVDDFFLTAENAPLTGNLLTNDSDPNAHTLTILSVDDTTQGNLIVNSDGTFSYDPNGKFDFLEPGETATDTFTYTISDGNEGTDTASVSVTIAGRATRVGDLAALDGSNGFVIPGLMGDDELGRSVSNAGDVNGDGIDDILLGAPGVDPDNGVNGAGATYVIFGRPADEDFPETFDLSSLLPSDGFIISGIDAGDVLGFSVSAAGDVNGDGIDDLIMGAINRGIGAGESYVIFGGSSIANTFDLTTLNGSNGFAIRGIDDNNFSGISVSGAGDVNGDGVDDVLIGAYLANFPKRGGEVYVIYGRPSGTPFPATLNLSDLNSSDGLVIPAIDGTLWSLGRSVSGAGDVNGDGFDDIIIGAPFAEPDGNIAAGTSYVIFGNGQGASFPSTFDLSKLDGSNGFRIDGVETGDNLGYVSGAGDVNGDGINDIIIGAEDASPNGDIRTGASYVVFGRPPSVPFPATLNLADLDGTRGFTIAGVAGGDLLGRSVSGAGDVNGDGVDDIIIGAFDASRNGKQFVGESYVIYGRPSDATFPTILNLADLTPSDGFVIPGLEEYDTLGTSVSEAGDVNGDGVDDIIIGAAARFARDFGKIDAGESYVIFGVAENSLPTATDDYFSVAEDGLVTRNLLENDSVPNTNPLTVVSVDKSNTLGEVTFTPQGSFTYDPNGKFDALEPGDTATDTFTYTIEDVNGNTDSATVTITVEGTSPVTTYTVELVDGAQQRSMITTIGFQFSDQVTIQDGAFEVTNDQGTAFQVHVATALINGNTEATLTFSGAGIVGGSLPDGDYNLTIHSEKIIDRSGNALDGDLDGVSGGDGLISFFRLFGDTDGDGDVDDIDRQVGLGAYRSKLGDANYLAYLDFDGDGDIDRRDAKQFNKRFWS